MPGFPEKVGCQDFLNPAHRSTRRVRKILAPYFLLLLGWYDVGVDVFRWFSRIFFPSWKFFEDVGETPELFVRWEGQETWTSCSWKMDFQWSQFFLNPQTLKAWALDTLLKRFISEERPSFTTERWIANWTQSCLPQSYQGELRFQWKVQLKSMPNEIVFISPFIETRRED